MAVTFQASPVALHISLAHLLVRLDGDLALDRLPLRDRKRLSKVKHRLLPMRVLREGPRGESHRFVQLHHQYNTFARG